MLLLLLLLQQSTASVVALQPKPIIKRTDSCPDVGYFFKRDPMPNAIDPGPCLLCFCKDNSSAVCWRRDNSRCDHKNYRHYGKRDTRHRRSPGFSDIFFRDATRDVLDRRTPEQCKPYESSFSEGCPPADWCIGCTVCDCDANGRWDCHILSFCPDKKGKKQVQKKKSAYRSKNIKRSNIIEAKTKKNAVFKKTTPKKITQKGKTTKPPKKIINKTQTKKSLKRSPNTNRMTIQGKKVPQIKKNTKKIQNTTKKAIDSKNINNKSITNQKTKRNSYKEALENIQVKNDTYKLAEAIVKKVMSSVEKLMNEKQKMMNTINPKMVQKRFTPKRNETRAKKTTKTDNDLPRKHWIKKVKLNKEKLQPKHNTRDKRSIDITDVNKTVTIIDSTQTRLQLRNETTLSLLEPSNVSASTKALYYKYEISNSTTTAKIEFKITTPTIQINNNTSEAKISLKQSYLNDIDKDFIKQLHELKIKHDNLIATRMKLNDTWKDLQTLLSRENNKRMYKKYKENKTESNISDEKNLNKSCGKVCTFKKVFKKIIYGSDTNTTDIDRAKIKKISLVTTLKNFFKPLLTKIKPRNKKYIQARNNKNILSTLCRKFELCTPDLSDKQLQSKLTELNRETQRIFKIVSSIKGLLHLLNMTGNSSETETHDIEKLDQILRELYLIDEDKPNITETKRIQIQYVKRNTREFVKSLEKFAFTLKDIIHILQNQSKVSTIKSKIRHRNMRCAKHLSMNRKQKSDEKLTKLKNLLLNYNLLQNRFMSKMYDVLTSSESQEDGVKPKVSEKRVFNNSFDTETYSRNIIENLRKLQILGQKLSSSTRVKRETMGDDDAIDYLLVLMEYLLKQNKPVVNPQVSDGIDLLIDAIKNAPDIKPITLNAVTFTTYRTPTRTAPSSESTLFSSRTHNKSKHHLHAKTDSSDDNFYDPDEKNNLKGNEINATPLYDKKIIENQIENTEIVGGEVINSAQVYFNKNPSEGVLDTFLKEKTDKKSSRNKYEVYNADDDDEDDIVDLTLKKLHKNADDTYMKAKVDIEKEREKILNHVDADVGGEINYIKNKSEIISSQDWEIDNIDLDLKVERTTKGTVTPLQATRTTRRHADKYINPISGMSSEELENHSKPITQSPRKLKKIDIFSSFDYNTERTDVDSDSKEDKNDAFSDFV